MATTAPVTTHDDKQREGATLMESEQELRGSSMSSLEFRAEMHWPGTVQIDTSVERVGRSSAALAQALFVDDACVATAESIVALMNTTTRRSTLLPLETAEALRVMTRPSVWVPAARTIGVSWQ